MVGVALGVWHLGKLLVILDDHYQSKCLEASRGYKKEEWFLAMLNGIFQLTP